MPTYGSPQVGGQLSAVGPGDATTLFDGTETPALNTASIAFARGEAAGMPPQGTTFRVTGAPSGMTIDVQSANDNTDGHYSTVATITPDANGNGAYTDIGYSKFYRYKISAYTTGAMPVCGVQR